MHIDYAISIRNIRESDGSGNSLTEVRISSRDIIVHGKSYNMQWGNQIIAKFPDVTR